MASGFAIDKTAERSALVHFQNRASPVKWVNFIFLSQALYVSLISRALQRKRLLTPERARNERLLHHVPLGGHHTRIRQHASDDPRMCKPRTPFGLDNRLEPDHSGLNNDGILPDVQS